MKKLSAHWLLASAALALAGCASMTPEQCKVADWYQVGLDDGANGEPPRTQLADYTEDCAKVGVRPDAARYRAGWEAGIPRFCTPYSGWREGTRGNTSKQDACRGRMNEGAFSMALNAGLEVYRTRQAISSNDSEIRRLEKRLQDKGLSDQHRRETRDRLRYLDFEQSRLRRLLADQESMAPR